MAQGKVQPIAGGGAVKSAASSKLWTSAKIYNNSSAYDDASRYQGSTSPFGNSSGKVVVSAGQGVIRSF